MTDTALPGAVPGSIPDDAPPPDGADAGTPDAPGVEDPEPAGRNRRKALLLLLLALVASFLLFATWYLLNRKPVTELPLPGIPAAAVPHYSFSIYDVVAPTGVAVNADGSRIYATQTEGDRQVIAFDGAGKQIGSLMPPPSAPAGYIPVYVAVNPLNGDVYVTDRAGAAVYVYAADGAYLRTFDPGPRLAGWAPLGIAFDAKGDLFVTNVGAPYQAVHEFGPDGSLLQTYGKPDEFDFPNGVAADAEGNVYVTDSNNGRLVVFDPQGKQIGVIRRGSAPADLGLPRGAAIDGNGRIYVADLAQQGIQSYQAIAAGDRGPKYVAGFGTEGVGDGAFRLPNAVAVDGRARVYIADWRNNRIQVWSY